MMGYLILIELVESRENYMNILTALLVASTLISITTPVQDLPIFHVKGAKLTAKYQDDKEKMTDALRIFEKVMNDKMFQKKLSDTAFLFDLPEDPMRTLSSRQIVATLFSGKEWYHTDADNTADIIWNCSKRKHKPPLTTAIGYGDENDSTINTYIFFVRHEKMEDIVNNLAHEWSHKVGFDHQKKKHPERDKTVPYLFGDLVGEFSKKYLVDNR
ncbi:MAG TPA: hypothetical protein VIU12_08525 [Chryseolinea sp.]